MSPALLSQRIVTARIAWVREMTARIRALPLDTYESFSADSRNVASAESYLRRGLEALLDLGRHLLAKGFGIATTEYKEIATRLEETGVLAGDQAATLVRLAGYRNRLVHFYHEVSDRELYEICSGQLGDVDRASDVIASWIGTHADLVDTSA